MNLGIRQIYLSRCFFFHVFDDSDYNMSINLKFDLDLSF